MTRPAVRLPDDLRRQIIRHCLSELPIEGCGLLAVSAGGIVAVYPAANMDLSATSYTVLPADHFAALQEAESKGWEIGGVFHSHPRGTAAISMADVRKALDPEWVYLVVGLAGEPEIRGWWVRDGNPEEVSLEAN